MPIRWLDEEKPKVSTTEDILRALGSGAIRGVASLPGMLGDIQGLAEAAAVGGRRIYAGDEAAEDLRRQYEAEPDVLPTTESLASYVPGGSYEPQTTGGRFARTGAEFGVGGLLTGGLAGARTAGQFARAGLAQGVVPGIASEGAASLPGVQGTAAEPWARGIAALAAGGAGTAMTMPSTAADVVSQGARGATPQQLQQAEALFQRAQAAGLPLTRAEAVQQVTGGATNLGNVQRVVEGQGGLRPMMAQRPEQVAQAGTQALDIVGQPRPAYPGVAGPVAQEGAEATLERTRGRINQITRPDYDAAAQGAVPPAIVERLQADPIYRRAVEAIRTNPNLDRQVAALPDNSPVFVDYVHRYLRDELARPAANPTALGNLEAANVGVTAGQAREAAGAASPELVQARQRQAELRQQYLAPLETGPMGRIARTPETQGAIEALFPQGGIQPAPGEVSRAVQAIRNQGAIGERAAQDLVRTYLQSQFDTATQRLQGGPNEFGGATFAKAVTGNPTRAANLEAAVRALPDGAQRWQGFENLLEIMEATGQRQRIGSQTAFNIEMLRQMEQGGPATAAAKVATGSPLSLPRRWADQLDRWNMGNNVEEIARLLTDPRMGARFRMLAEAPPGLDAGVADRGLARRHGHPLAGAVTMTNSLLSPLSFTSWFDAATGDVITVDVYFYNAGTDTETTVYTDGLLQIAHDQPVRTGGSGRLPPVFVSETPTLYRIRAYDVDGVLLEDVDNLPGAQPDADSVPPPLDLDYDGFLAVGDIIARFGMPIARTGFVLCNGGTIGSAGSSATELAGDDALALFTWLWEQDDAGGESLTVSGGRGADAATDWAANKTITVPDLRGRVIAGLDQMDAALAASRLTTTFFGSAGLTSGLSGGSQNHLLTIAELAAHTHVPYDAGGFWGIASSGGGFTGHGIPDSGTNLSFLGNVVVTGWVGATTAITTSTGLNDSHNNLQPTMTLCFYIRAPVYVP